MNLLESLFSFFFSILDALIEYVISCLIYYTFKESFSIFLEIMRFSRITVGRYTCFVYHRFYVGCDLCNDWFHGTCVGITEDMAMNIDEFICDECEKQKQNVEEDELYCLCKQPYDDSKYVYFQEMFFWNTWRDILKSIVIKKKLHSRPFFCFSFRNLENFLP